MAHGAQLLFPSRVGRARFSVEILLLLAATGLLGRLPYDEWRPTGSTLFVVIAAVVLLGVIVQRCYARMRDTARPGRDLIFLILPFANVFFLFDLLSRPSATPTIDPSSATPL